MAFKKLVLLMALGVATTTTNASNLVDISSSEDDDMVAPYVDFDSFSDDLEELGPGDEYLMDAIFEHRDLQASEGKKNKASPGPPGLEGKNKTADDSIVSEEGGWLLVDGSGKNGTKVDKGNRTKGDGPPGLEGKNKTKGGGLDDLDDLVSDDEDGSGRNKTKPEKGNSTKRGDGPPGLEGKNKTKGGLDDLDDLVSDDEDGSGRNKTKPKKGNSTKRGDGPPGLEGKNKTKGGGLDDLDDEGKGKNRTKAEKEKKTNNSTRGDGPPGLEGKNKTKGEGLDDLDDEGKGKNRTKAENKGKNSTRGDGPPGLEGKNKTKGGLDDLDDLGGKGKNRTKAEKGKNSAKDGPPGLEGKNKTKKAIKTKLDSKGMPVWWDEVKVNYTKTKGTRLKQCSRRTKPPMDGERCSNKNKTCYFGSQVCPGELDYPSLKCECANRAWNCETESCTGCPAARPVTNETCSIESLSCDYGGEVQCCGNAFPESNCKCNGGLWKCDASTQCISPTCTAQTWNVVNQTCARARRKVLADYPGMNVQCVAEGTAPSEKYDINRVEIVVDNKNRAVANPVVG